MNIGKSLRISKQQSQGCLQTHNLLLCTFLHYARLSIHVTTCSIFHGNTSQCMERALGERSRVMQQNHKQGLQHWPFPCCSHIIMSSDSSRNLFSVPNPHLVSRVAVRWRKEEDKKNKNKIQKRSQGSWTWTSSQPIPKCSGSTSSLHVAAGRSSAKSVWESGTQVLSTLQNIPHFQFTSPLTSHKLTWMRPQLFVQTEASWNI